MRTEAAILVIFLAQCAHLRAEPKPGFREEIGEILHSDSCIFGVKSMSIYLYNSKFQGKVIAENETCDNIDPSKPIFFVVHGFISFANATIFRELSLRLAEKGNTVFALDWSQGACTDGIPLVKLLNYPFAVVNIHDISHLMARYTESLIECGIPLENITYIGHSLGAHVSGLAAKSIQKSQGNITLLIAADPADPLLGYKKCEERFCKSDAEHVVVLHTSPLGIGRAVGHLDLYFEDGKTQPGCMAVDLACSHSRSVEYITAMIEDNCGYRGDPKESSSLQWLSSWLPNSRRTKMNNVTECVFINSNILDSNNFLEGEYTIKNPQCTQEASNCKQ